MRHSSKKNKAETASSGRGTIYMTLSLFIILLSFMIVLTSNADISPEKTLPVLDSIDKSFGLSPTHNARIPVLSSIPPRLSKNDRILFDQIENLFRAQTTPIETQIIGNDNILFMRIPLKDLVEALGLNRKRSTAKHELLMARLSAMLSRDSNQTQYEANILLGIGQNPALLDLAPNNEEYNNVILMDKVARRLIKGGVPAKLITTGLHRGKKDFVDLYFYALGTKS